MAKIKAQKNNYAALSIIALALIIVVLGVVRKDFSKETPKLDAIALSVIKDFGISDRNLTSSEQAKGKSRGHTFLRYTRNYSVSPKFDFDDFVKAMERKLKGTDFKFAKSSFVKEAAAEKKTAYFAFKNRIIYEISFLKKKYEVVIKPKGKGALIAIVLDDFGNNKNNLDTLFSIKLPLTLSVLPDLPYSRYVAEEAPLHNMEVILHMPMEPEYSSSVDMEPNTIMAGMEPKKVKELLSNAIASVPQVKGVSNHMGSKATKDKIVMKALLEELKKRRLYFLDSLTSDDSVGKEIASKLRVPNAERDMFLDNSLTESNIEKALMEAAERASKQGFAVAIGHDRPNTIKVLAKVMPRLNDEGYKFVHLSNLVK